jgi:hypothetical protein
MKKKAVKKLRLSRETLRDLMSSDVQRVVGGSDMCSETACDGACWVGSCLSGGECNSACIRPTGTA